MQHFDVAILGAGAAGLMCALTAGQRGRRVLLLDHAAQPGGKILISGGGRCNFTNLEVAADRFLSANPHFCKAALNRYHQRDFIALVQRHDIAYHEKTLGQLFCDGSARQILAMLLAECAAGGVDIRSGHAIGEISRGACFQIATDHGGFSADALVLASGGLSIPKMGASNLAHRVARQFGLALTEVRPALVPLALGGDDLALAQPLSGVAVAGVASLGRRSFREGLLFTHRGLSGPAILQISSYWREGDWLTLDLLPDLDAAAYLLSAKRQRPKAALKTVLATILPARLAQRLAERAGTDAEPMAELTDHRLRAVAERLKRWRLQPVGSEGYAKAEVTRGGIDTAALSSHSMAARDVPGLFAIGEAVDVTGWLGGYNFQWAWSSGWCAGMAV